MGYACSVCSPLSVPQTADCRAGPKVEGSSLPSSFLADTMQEPLESRIAAEELELRDYFDVDHDVRGFLVGLVHPLEGPVEVAQPTYAIAKAYGLT